LRHHLKRVAQLGNPLQTLVNVKKACLFHPSNESEIDPMSEGFWRRPTRALLVWGQEIFGFL
ncbi:MAG: hypothetical protein ACFB22_14615, partial [Rhodothalassiaceae bacterium]